VKDEQMPAEAVVRVAQALEAQMGASTLQRLAEAALEAMGDAPGEVERLAQALHLRCAHPDWDYATTHGRAPQGEGWVLSYQGEEGPVAAVVGAPGSAVP